MMAPPIVWVFLFGYLFIGLFVNGFLKAIDDEDFSPIIILGWSIVISILMMLAIIHVPFWIGEKIGYFIKNISKNRGDKQ